LLAGVDPLLDQFYQNAVVAEITFLGRRFNP
jgi:hypothetical protein